MSTGKKSNVKINSLKASMRVHIPAHIYAEIDHYVQSSDDEISGLGKVIEREDGTLEVSKVYLLEQVNGAASTDLDPEAVAAALYESREDEGHLNFWWHSHCTFGVFWSQTDMDTIKQFGDKGFLLATVFNHKREYKTAYYQGSNGFLPEVFIDDIPTDFSSHVTKELKEQWDKNIEEKVTKQTFPSWTGNSNGGWSGNYTIDDPYGSYVHQGRIWNGIKGCMVPLSEVPNDKYYVQGDRLFRYTNVVVKTKAKETKNGNVKVIKGTTEGATTTKKEETTTEETKEVDGVGDTGLDQSEILEGFQTLYSLIGYSEANQWEECYCDHRDVHYQDVNDRDLMEYYVDYDGDLEKAITEAYMSGVEYTGEAGA